MHTRKVFVHEYMIMCWDGLTSLLGAGSLQAYPRGLVCALQYFGFTHRRYHAPHCHPSLTIITLQYGKTTVLSRYNWGMCLAPSSATL